jgi:hypothetical protein
METIRRFIKDNRLYLDKHSISIKEKKEEKKRGKKRGKKSKCF